jgi:protein-S-isoprenylcysteine O-methyltransferase Ste14
LIILAVAIYALSTVVFGLRFSNLTNRGIVSTGPYRWSKHPAYISKNLSWWMISLPFVAGAGWQVALQSSLLLGIVNLIYYLRARTEERHLMADPAYREYAAFIARHGLFAKAGMLVGVGGRKSAQS